MQNIQPILDGCIQTTSTHNYVGRMNEWDGWMNVVDESLLGLQGGRWVGGWWTQSYVLFLLNISIGVWLWLFDWMT